MNDFLTSIYDTIQFFFPQFDLKAITNPSKSLPVRKKEALCLVVNAKHLHNIQVDKDISREETKKLLDKAKFFLCTSKEKCSKILDQLEEKLEIRKDDKNPLNHDDLEDFFVSIIFVTPFFI